MSMKKTQIKKRYHTWCDNDIYCLSADCLFVTGKVLLMSHLYYWYWYWSIPIIVPIPMQTPTDYREGGSLDNYSITHSVDQAPK